MAFDLFEALKKNEVKVEDVIAEKGGKAPRLCAASGRRLVQPWITYHLSNTHYLRVMARFQYQWAWDAEAYRKVKALVSANPKTNSTKFKTEVKS